MSLMNLLASLGASSLLERSALENAIMRSLPSLRLKAENLTLDFCCENLD